MASIVLPLLRRLLGGEVPDDSKASAAYRKNTVKKVVRRKGLSSGGSHELIDKYVDPLPTSTNSTPAQSPIADRSMLSGLPTSFIRQLTEKSSSAVNPSSTNTSINNNNNNNNDDKLTVQTIGLKSGASGSSIAGPINNSNNDSAENTPHTTLQRAVRLHEQDQLQQAFRMYCDIARQGQSIGLLLVGLSLRHGWGCQIDRPLAFECLQHSVRQACVEYRRLKALGATYGISGCVAATSTTPIAGSNSAEQHSNMLHLSATKSLPRQRSPSTTTANGMPIAAPQPRMQAAASTGAIVQSTTTTTSTTATTTTTSASNDPSVAGSSNIGNSNTINNNNNNNRSSALITESTREAITLIRCELAMALYELGQCHRFSWGVVRPSKSLAVYYYRLASDLGDWDAQLDLARCYANGYGTSTNRYLAACYYRMAFTQRKRDEFGMSWVFKEKYTAYFKENFPVQFAREQRWLQQKQLGGQQKNGETTAAAAVKSNADVSGAVNQDGQVTRVKTTNNSSEYDSADVDIIQSEIGGLKWALSGGGENAVELSSSLQKLRSIHERLQNSLAAISPIAAASSYTPGITVTNSSNADVSNLNSN